MPYYGNINRFSLEYKGLEFFIYKACPGSDEDSAEQFPRLPPAPKLAAVC